MKQIRILVAALALTAVTLISCDRPISVEELPEAARTYIKTRYPNCKIQVAVRNDDMFTASYDVKLDNGIELNFDRDGAKIDR